MSVAAKICGINSAAAMAAAVDGGAAFVGLVFYPPSPRHVSPDEAADLAAAVPPAVTKVGLFVDADDETLAGTLERVPLDLLQLHGSEGPERVAEIKARFGLPVMKAVQVSGESDLAVADGYLEGADRLLFDAKPPADMAGVLPGGNALSFDWRLLAGRDWALPWMLSGGLDAGNVAEAVATSGAAAVDVSSGVEDRRGRKDPILIAEFLAAVGRL